MGYEYQTRSYNFEMAGVEEKLAREALTLACHKLPFKTKIISRKDSNEIY